MVQGIPVIVLSLLMATSIGVSAPARAADCHSASPNLRESRSIWDPAGVQPVSTQLRNRILAFFAQLQGAWHGSGGTTACVDSGRQTMPVKANERLKLTVTRQGQSAYRFSFQIYDTQNQVSTSYGFTVQAHRHHFTVTGEGNAGISRFYSEGIGFHTQTAMRTGFHRRLGGGNTVLSLETERQLSLQDGALVFSKAVFHNGQIIDFSHWEFARG